MSLASRDQRALNCPTLVRIPPFEDLPLSSLDWFFFLGGGEVFEEPVAAPKGSCPLEVANLHSRGPSPISPAFFLGTQHSHK